MMKDKGQVQSLKKKDLSVVDECMATYINNYD